MFNNLTVLIPAYNETENIEELVWRIIKSVPNSEIIVIDDGSLDGTGETSKHIKYKKLKVIRNDFNLGKGRSVKEGANLASGEITIQIDADLQFQPEEIYKLIVPIKQNRADIVLGSRYMKGGKIERGSVSIVKRVGSYILSGLISLICRKRYTDVFAGFKAWRTQIMKAINLKIANFGYEAEIVIMAKRKGYKCIEIPISYKKRRKGKSKIKFLRDMFIIPCSIFKISLFR